MEKQLLCCRRNNYVHAAYVNAAMRIHGALGSDRAYWMLIREGVPASVIQRVLRGNGTILRQPRGNGAGRTPLLIGRYSASLAADRRHDRLTAQRVEVGLVFQHMLGTEAAAHYLRDARVPVWLTARVLGSARRRPSEQLMPT